ncbi:MAG: hypothetical protein R3337_00165 [Gammaproteobacteria bacterium]|nr:hypothetical protein [Gammaproteobacteria bacterium]
MTTLLHAKRDLQRRAGAVEFARSDDPSRPIEVRLVTPRYWYTPSGQEAEQTLLGTGEDHLEAILAAHDTLDGWHKAELRECRGDYMREQLRDAGL